MGVWKAHRKPLLVKFHFRHDVACALQTGSTEQSVWGWNLFLQIHTSMGFKKIVMSYFSSPCLPNSFLVLSALVCSGFLLPKEERVEATPPFPVPISRPSPLGPSTAGLLPLKKDFKIPGNSTAPRSSAVFASWLWTLLPLGFASGHRCSLSPVFKGCRKKNSFKINQERKRIKVLFSYQGVCRPHFFGSKEKKSEAKVKAASSQVNGPVYTKRPPPSCVRASCPFLRPIPGSQQSPENVTTCALCFHTPSIRSSP